MSPRRIWTAKEREQWKERTRKGEGERAREGNQFPANHERERERKRKYFFGADPLLGLKLKRSSSSSNKEVDGFFPTPDDRGIFGSSSFPNKEILCEGVDEEAEEEG